MTTKYHFKINYQYEEVKGIGSSIGIVEIADYQEWEDGKFVKDIPATNMRSCEITEKMRELAKRLHTNLEVKIECLNRVEMEHRRDKK